MKPIRSIIAVATAAAAVAVAASPAAAAPVNSPRAEELIATCPGGDVAIVPAPGNGTFTPGFFVGTRQLLVPYRFTFTFSDGEETITETVSKKAPLPRGAITCTFSETIEEDGQVFTFSGSVVGVVRGKR